MGHATTAPVYVWFDSRACRRDDRGIEPRLAWLLSSCYWILVGLANTTDTLFVRPGPRPRAFGEIFGSEMTLTLFWIPLTAAIFWATGRFPLERGRWRRHASVHAALCAAIIVGRAIFVFALDPLLHFYDVAPTFSRVMLHSVYNNAFFYWLQAGVAHAVLFGARERRRERMAAALERELANAELGALKARGCIRISFSTPSTPFLRSFMSIPTQPTT